MGHIITRSTRIAVVTRGGWEGHSPGEATDLFIPFLVRSGFDVQTFDTLEVYTDGDLMNAADLVMQCWTMGEITDEQAAGLTRSVVNGAGFAGWHGGIVDSFRNSADYLHLTGGQFATHPSKPEHACVPDAQENYFIPHRVQIAAGAANHPIVAGLDDFDLVTEQYWVLTDSYNDILATTTHPSRADQPWQEAVTCPAVWTRRWGAGRVFVATPGHDPSVLKHPTVRTIVERGLIWASR